jgi:hypothetical protein
MRSAYNVHPEFGWPNLRRKAGLALAFIVFGSIAGASGIVVQIAGDERTAGGRAVIAAIHLNPSATLSTVVSPASPPCECVGSVCVAIQSSAGRTGGCNCRSAASAAYGIGDRATPTTCRCFQEVAKNGAQPEPA